jgi:tRNA A-37 threonylcarbamoyl transferase component Bud32
MSFQNYKIISSLGERGKEGKVFLVRKRGRDYAMKQFKSTKSGNMIEREAQLQSRASEIGISPKVLSYDKENKVIIMEKMDYNLFDILRKTNGKLQKKIQEDIVSIIKNLDKAKIFHNDPSPLNFMFKNDKLYIIDFGFAKPIDSKLSKKLSDQPNMDYMIIGFLLKIKKIFPDSNYTHLKKFISKENKEVLDL